MTFPDDELPFNPPTPDPQKVIEYVQILWKNAYIRPATWDEDPSQHYGYLYREDKK